MRKEFFIQPQNEMDGLPFIIITGPTEDERKALVKELDLDDHTISAALDPDEVARLELDPAYPNFLVVIFKVPKNHSAEDKFLLRTSSVGIVMFNNKLACLSEQPSPVIDVDPEKIKKATRSDVLLKFIAKSIVHFREHMRFISSVSDELQQQVYHSASNKHLAELFTLQRSLVYYVTAIGQNGALLSKLKKNSTKLRFTEENIELLDDIIADNDQCYRQAEVTSGILASLMDARASIINNNLQILMKMLNIVTIAIMVPTLVVSIFSMNVNFPLQHHPGTFWFILSAAFAAAIGIMLFLVKSKWGRFY